MASTRRLAALLLSGGALLASPSSASAADAVTAWNENAGQAAIAACISPVIAANPLHESRLYAIVHVAIHDALNAIVRRYEPYAYDVRVGPSASPEAAVAAAARDTLVALIPELPLVDACKPGALALVEADYAAALATIADGAAKTLGVQAGQAAAAAILARRANDGSEKDVLDFGYEDRVAKDGLQPGEYRFTPGNTFAFAPEWGDVPPFVLHHSTQFRPKRPLRVTSRKYAADFDEVKALGGDDIVTPSSRTADQTEIGLFWIESSPLQWNRIARTVSAATGLDLWENARLFGLLNMTLADGYIGSFAAKYEYAFWRPVTAIHEADTDGNPATVVDPFWTPLQPTYASPDYDSAHAVQGGAAARLLARFFGSDDIAFTACSMSLPTNICTDASPTRRSYVSFSQAAEENGLSRILIGIHFRHAVEEGIKHGRKIGDRAINLFMRPAP
jgi:hypothetical protein